MSRIAKENGFGKWMTGKKLSEETKKKIGLANSIALKGRKSSEEARKNMSKAHIGVRPSKETRKKLSKASIGNRNHFWKGGKLAEYPEYTRIRKSVEYRLWREAVLSRDNWTCQKTGIKGGKIVAHHIHNFADYPELRTSIENGITLLVEEHREFHKIYGKNNNTKEQLEEFLLK